MTRGGGLRISGKGVGMLVGNFELNPLKETVLGVDQAFFDTQQRRKKYTLFLYFFACNPERSKFTPLSETTSIPTHFIYGAPPPPPYLNHIVKRPGYNLNHLKHNIQDQGNLIFQEMIRNMKINQSKSKEVYTT